MYGNNKEVILNNLVSIDWFGKKLLITKINEVNKKLLNVRNELIKLPIKYHKYFKKTAGSFNYRSIAGEVYLKSGHEDKAWKLNIGVFKIRKGKTWVHREKEKFIAMSLKPVQ
jgi:hypothetical protein